MYYYFYDRNENFYESGEVLKADDYIKNIPIWLTNKRIKCIVCGAPNLFLKECACRYCRKNKDFDSFNSHRFSVVVGIFVLKWLNENYNNKKVYFNNKKIKDALINIIRKSVPILPPSMETKDSPKLYMKFNGEYVWDENFCDELIRHYCNEHNKTSYLQHISSISIRGLFGYHSYDLNINKDISIIFGTNGLGKTTIFKFLEYIFIKSEDENNDIVNQDKDLISYKYNERITFLSKTVFNSIKIKFKSGDSIHLYKKISKKDPFFCFYYHTNSANNKYKKYAEALIISFTSPYETILEKFKEHYVNINLFLPDINNNDKFLFIKLNRSNEIQDLRFLLYKNILSESTNQQVNNKLLNDINYVVEKPKFDRDFLNNYLSDCIENLNGTLSILFGKLELLDDTRDYKSFPFLPIDLYMFLRKKYESLIPEKEKKEHAINKEDSEKLITFHKLIISNSPKVNEYKQEILDLIYSSTYAVTRSITKITIELYRKFLLFRKIFEGLYFEYDPVRKKIDFNNEGILILSNKTLNFDFSNQLDYSSLSSGELNILTVLYYLIFKTTSNSIVLIDEPEISLHVAWQQQFTDIVKEVMKENPGMQVIVASHSPFITSGHDEYFVSADLIEEGVHNGK